MQDDKLDVVLECLALDNPRSAREYIDNLMTWSIEELVDYRDKRELQVKSLPETPFRPHP